MKINKKTWSIIGIIFAEAIFIFSIFSGYYIHSGQQTNRFESMNLVEYTEPNSNTIYEILSKGKTVAIIYSENFESKGFYENLSKEFYSEVIFFLVKRNVSQAIIISPIKQTQTFNLTSQSLIKEICKVVVNAPPICIES